LFYIFYNQERWDNWLKTLSEASFEVEPTSENFRKDFPGSWMVFSVDITLEVLKNHQACTRTSGSPADGALRQDGRGGSNRHDLYPNLGDLRILHCQSWSLQAAEILKRRVRQGHQDAGQAGKAQIDKDMELALETASNIAAAVIDGAACCGKYVEDDLENPTLFDEWFIECERINDSMTSLKNFDESTGTSE
jgi:hypothetical protein